MDCYSWVFCLSLNPLCHNRSFCLHFRIFPPENHLKAMAQKPDTFRRNLSTERGGRTCGTEENRSVRWNWVALAARVDTCSLSTRRWSLWPAGMFKAVQVFQPPFPECRRPFWRPFVELASSATPARRSVYGCRNVGRAVYPFSLPSSTQRTNHRASPFLPQETFKA